LIDYRTILIDPPWYERGAGKIKRGADNHYPIMKTHEILHTILSCPHWKIDKNAHLYLWVTNNFLQDGLKLMEALGFRYITNIAWVKDSIGLGQYFRGQHELCLFGVKGILRTQTKNTPTVLMESKREHSQKPAKMYRLIENQSPPPRLELFARESRHGWTSWGNELSSQLQQEIIAQ
jgi:N6-adenosine-specific RNA methylase IME4